MPLEPIRIEADAASHRRDTLCRGDGPIAGFG
jgi:hypothetical protein